MAAPGSLPAKARAARRRKPFTVAEANRALTLVRRIAQDIVAAYAQYMRLLLERTPDGPEASGQTRAWPRVEAVRDQLNDYIAELQAVGVELDDAERGIVHFPARHQNRDVYLCWQLGEEGIGYWHELHGSLASRRPVSVLVED